MAIKRIGILVGGGPAPGTNGVISAVVIEAIKAGCTPVGFHDGFQWLAERYTDEQHEMTIDEVSRIHLDGGVGIGKAASATCTIIPEEFRTDRVSLSDICDIVEGTIIKRRAMNRPYGVVLLSEALVERFDPEEVAELQDVDRDAQGNIRVAEIDLGRKVKSEVQARLERRGIKVTLVDKTIGYELRCAPPIPYDAEYARDLGYAAFDHLYRGGTGAVITTRGGEFQAVPFEQVIEPSTGGGRQRPVDVDTESYQVARDYMVRVGPKDFRDDAWVARLADCAGMSTTE